MTTYLKNADEDLAVTIDFSDDLNGDTIASVVWTTGGLTEESTSETTTAATGVFSGGTAGLTYNIEANATTAGGLNIIKAVSAIIIDEQPSATDGLTTVSRVAVQLGVTNETDVFLLSSFINEATAMIERYCGRKFKQETITTKFAGNGERYIFLDRLPVNSITSITHDGQTVPSSDYEISNAETGEIFNRYGWIETVAKSSTVSRPDVTFSEEKLYSISYSGGYILPGNASRSLPYDLERACVELVKSMFSQRKNDPSVTKQSLSGVASVEYGSGQGAANMPSSVVAILDNYRLMI